MGQMIIVVHFFNFTGYGGDRNTLTGKETRETNTNTKGESMTTAAAIHTISTMNCGLYMHVHMHTCSYAHKVISKHNIWVIHLQYVTVTFTCI